MDDKKVIKAHAFELSKMLAEIFNARLRAEVLLNAKEVHHTAKYMLKKIVNDLNNAEKNFKYCIGDEGYQKMKDGLLNDEHAPQIDNMITHYMSLPEGIRRQEEDRLISLSKIYSKNG